ncbi:ribonuclease E/G [Klebsiella pneumoniae]|nr:ribonuclease E/G [Klebsiella pneumoniae]
MESEAERERLKKVVAEYCDEQGGFIIRTAAEGVHEQRWPPMPLILSAYGSKVMERKKRNQTRYQLYVASWFPGPARAAHLPDAQPIAFASTRV